MSGTARLLWISAIVLAAVPAARFLGAATPPPRAARAAVVVSAPASAASSEALWDAWPAARFVPGPAPCLGPDDLVGAIRRLEARHPGRVGVEEVGRSVRGRPIHLLKLGRGARRILLWSQMHGDEPSATPALLDVAHHLLSGGAPAAGGILESLTLLMVPMLNPDGAELFTRRNAQGIDVNRDALELATPEGRLLKALRERFEPELGFNLHDQDRRTTVGDTGVLATVALLAVAGDAEGTMTPGRARARRVCAAIVRALRPLVPGGIARYDEDWNARAFGDNLTAWGTPVVLIESGGLPEGWTYEDLTRLNFVALLSALSGLAGDDLAGEDPAPYVDLARNEDGVFADVIVSGGEVWQPGAGEPYRADLAFDLLDDDRVVAACPRAPGPGPSRLREVGDARLMGTARRIDATGCLVVPGLAASVRGLESRAWLEAGGIGALARLGVVRLRWHVDASDRAEAVAAAGFLEGAGRPSIEVTCLEDPAHLVSVGGPPDPPASARLDAALDALTGARWRGRAGEGTFGELLGPLAGIGGDEQGTPLLSRDEPATFLVLRATRPDATSPAELELERVFLDGRESEAEP